MTSRYRSPRTLVFLTMLAVLALSCRRTSLADLPLWRVEIAPDGTEARVVQLPFEVTAYDMSTHALIRSVLDRNHDGVSDRIVTYQGVGGARVEETDRDFDGLVDRWETFGADGKRLRSATARVGDRPDRIATYDRGGQPAKVEIDADLDGRFEVVRIYEAGKLVRIEIDGDGNGRTDRVQDFGAGYLSREDFDTDEDGTADLRMTYAPGGDLITVLVLNRGDTEKDSPR